MSITSATKQVINAKEVETYHLIEIYYEPPDWDSSTEYGTGSIVWRNSTAYEAQSKNTNKDPLSYPAYWTAIAYPLCWTNYGSTVSYDGKAYSPYPFKMGEIAMDSTGKVQPVTLTTGNVDEDRLIQRLIEDYELMGKSIKVIQAFKNAPDVIEYTFTIKDATASKGTVAFSLGSGIDVLLAIVPNRTIYQQFCRWQFGDTNCQHTPDPGETCGRLWEDCVAKGNSINFGGFPGISNSRLFF